MKKIISFVFAIMMMTMCLAVTSCEKNDAVTVTRSFVAGGMSRPLLWARTLCR